MAQWRKALTTKLGDWAHWWKERKDSCKMSFTATEKAGSRHHLERELSHTWSLRMENSHPTDNLGDGYGEWEGYVQETS